MSTKTIIEAGVTTPFISFDQEAPLFELRGRSSPESSIQFYLPVYELLESYPSDSSKEFTANFALEYFNTSSTKCLMDVLKRLKAIQEKGQQVKINWYYEEDDEDIMEIGEDLELVVDMPFNFIAVEEDEREGIFA